MRIASEGEVGDRSDWEIIAHAPTSSGLFCLTRLPFTTTFAAASFARVWLCDTGVKRCGLWSVNWACSAAGRVFWAVHALTHLLDHRFAELCDS